MSMGDNSNLEPNPYEGYRDPSTEETPEGGGKKGPNRTFLMILGVIGAIFVIALIVLIAFVLISRNRQTSRFQSQAATINAENTALALVASQTAQNAMLQMTEKAMPPTWTPTSALPSATRTPVPTRTATTQPVADSAARTATVAAFLTQVGQSTSGVQATITRTTTARATATRRTVTSTALPTTGFAEDVGLPGLFGLALALVVIIILARRLRLTANP